MRNMAWFVFLLAPIAVCAATITLPITSGTGNVSSISDYYVEDESFSIRGPGFSYTGSGPGLVFEFDCGGLYASDGVPCGPGGYGVWYPAAAVFRSEVVGNITIGSTSYNYIANREEGPTISAGMDFESVADVPATNAPTVTLSGRFSATGVFFDSRFQPDTSYEFIGHGTFTADFVLMGDDPYTGLPEYSSEGMHFVFQSVPEPDTGIFVVAALAVVVMRYLIRKKTYITN